MRPDTISASALKAAAGCLRRYKAEYLHQSKGMDNTAASTGSACHGALEQYVNHVYILKDTAPSIQYMEECFKYSFSKQFNSHDFTRPEYVDGWELVSNWFNRTDLSEHKVVATENKKRYKIGLSDGTSLPLTYIIDRLDINPHGEIEIVDYKGLDLTTEIPTPTGWTTMGKLSEGDEVIGGDGLPCRVLVKSEVHNRPCFKLTFDDGTHIVCDDEHRWALEIGIYWKPIVLTAQQLFNRGVKSRRQRDVRIPTTEVFLPEADLPIDPYVFGAWIGDGSTAAGVITKPLEELFDEIRFRGFDVGPLLGNNGRTVYGLRGGLRELGLLNNKHIPDIYLRASYDQRLDLLRGIMDTDGHWNPLRKRVVLNTTSQDYAKQVYELVVSLGWTANIFPTQADGFGRKWDAWQLWYTPTGANPFLARNQHIEIPTSARALRRIVKSIEQVPSVPTQCIEVDSKDHCYLAGRQMVKTHNTNRFPISHEELRQNIQARIYALMQQIENPETEIVWVTFDMLRHDKVTVSFTREDNTATWIWLSGEIERILGTSEDDAENNPTLNPECNFCSVKATCPKLIANINAGGIFSLSPAQLVDLKVAVEGQTKGLKALSDELDSVLGPLLRPADGSDNIIQGTDYDALVASRVVRNVDSNRVNQIVDPLILRDYIKPGTITLAAFEKLCKDHRVDPELVPVLRSLISKVVQAPSIKVVKR